MNHQCRKDGEDVFAVVAPVYNMRPGWYLSAAFPFVHHGVHKVHVGELVRCTRHGCGRYWVITDRGVQEPAGNHAIERENATLPKRDEKPDPRPAGQIEREYV